MTMTTAKCQDCDGPECDICDGSGERQVGVFNPICAQHCTDCQGEDHHWDYFGDEDETGEPLYGCKHCAALRPIPHDDPVYGDF